MSSSNEDEIISIANPHTIKKFELIEKYAETWAEKLLNIPSCQKLIFIDCMSNSGEYISSADNSTVYGTPVRVDRILRRAALKYQNKQIYVKFNDINTARIEHLRDLIANGTNNYSVNFYNEDCSKFLYSIRDEILHSQGLHYLLFYDPYKAVIDWNAIMPFFNKWGEVIINHMVSDTIRALGSAKSSEAVSKYENTYQADIESLLKFNGDRRAYEDRIKEIIYLLRERKDKDYFIASFPFFNRNNALVYNLIHCTGSEKGFTLYKKAAWQTFGGQSSNKNTQESKNQLVFDFDDEGFAQTSTDTYCYRVEDIAEYLQGIFMGQSVALADVWAELKRHPVFPFDGFRDDIKNILKTAYGAKESRGKIIFTGRRQAQ